jgi:hypothetical protein
MKLFGFDDAGVPSRKSARLHFGRGSLPCHPEVADAPEPPPKSPTRQSRYGDGARLRLSSEGG